MAGSFLKHGMLFSDSESTFPTGWKLSAGPAAAQDSSPPSGAVVLPRFHHLASLPRAQLGFPASVQKYQWFISFASLEHLEVQ